MGREQNAGRKNLRSKPHVHKLEEFAGKNVGFEQNSPQNITQAKVHKSGKNRMFNWQN